MRQFVRYSQFVTGGLAAAALLAYGHHVWNVDVATRALTTLVALGAIIGFVPPITAGLHRQALEEVATRHVAELQRAFDAKVEQLRREFAAEVTQAMRKAHEGGVYDGALRQSLARTAGEPPRPRRLHAVRPGREGA